MLRQFAHPATAFSLIALFIASTGGAFAAGHLIGSADIADHSIQLRDIAPAAVKALRGRQGSPGAKGTFDPTKISRVLGAVISVAPGTVGTADVNCSPGQVAIGGGGSGGLAGIAASVPDVPAGQTTPTGWAVIAVNQSSIAVNVQAFAVCAMP